MLDVKADYLAEIEAMSKRVRPRRQFTNDDSFADVQDERRRMKRLEKLDNGKTMFFKILTTVCVMIEKTATYFRPFGVTLGGWSNIVRQDQATYDSIIEEMFKTKSVPMPDDPFVKLGLALVMSAVTAAMGEKIIATAASFLRPNNVTSSAAPNPSTGNNVNAPAASTHNFASTPTQSSAGQMHPPSTSPAYFRSAFDEKKALITNPILLNFLSSKQSSNQAKSSTASGASYNGGANAGSSSDITKTNNSNQTHTIPQTIEKQSSAKLKNNDRVNASDNNTYKVPSTSVNNVDPLISSNLNKEPATTLVSVVTNKEPKTVNDESSRATGAFKVPSSQSGSLFATPVTPAALLVQQSQIVNTKSHSMTSTPSNNNNNKVNISSVNNVETNASKKQGAVTTLPVNENTSLEPITINLGTKDTSTTGGAGKSSSTATSDVIQIPSSGARGSKREAQQDPLIKTSSSKTSNTPNTNRTAPGFKEGVVLLNSTEKTSNQNKK